ncbi:MAG: hypothetical protein DMD37_04225 [Gemmatimonadetes bacterium]|nr:MAG: hypothetical protein DMD71_07595 [Gemmatimonadota bacterium]PYO84206.1 MAG: hypothetical protein DMD68_07425 [Gemmatimonadota bacterium]PYP63969.1 MAG: hypothetical protein DMD37_04225 [Gemmatimonadota bacterium]
MLLRGRLSRSLFATSALSLAAAVVAYLIAPHELWSRALIAGLLVIAGGLLGLQVVSTLRADRRYATLLEREVAAQTRSLMDSLAATAAAEHNVRSLMEAVPDAIVVLDPEGRVLDQNPSARAMVAVHPPPGTPPGHSAFESLDRHAAAHVRTNLDAAFRGEVRRFEVPFTHTDGGMGMRSVIYAPVREGGKIRKVLALVRDVSEQRRTDAQLQQAEKLAAMGQLVSGVAHEINNPAAIISGFAETLLLGDMDEEQRDMVRMIRDEAQRIGRITSNLLAFARSGGKERGLVDLNDIVQRTFALRSYYLTTLNILVKLDLDPDSPRTWANGSEMQQLLLNLLINAEQALLTVPPPRSIVLRTRTVDQNVLLQCVDTGPGVAPELRSKIFDPFFTTKPEGVGTGLGLSICYGIARDHGGSIWVDSTPGAGATFTVSLPRDPRAAPRPAAPPPEPATAPAPHLKVLVVDDEVGLRHAVVSFLERRGFAALGVGDGREALETLGRESPPPDVIVTDVRMPGMGGREFLARLRAEHPQLARRLVFSTGDTFAPETAALLQEAGGAVLVKPFDFSQLETVIRAIAAA